MRSIRRLCLLLGMVLATSVAAEDLPTGFGGITIGMPWGEVEARFPFEPRDQPVTAWDGFVRECGYRSVRIPAENGELLVEADDFTVTSVSYVSPIQPGSDLLAVADLVLRSYGQPDRATQRDALGQVTLDRAAVQYVTLEYGDPQPVVFTVAGGALWQYQVQVRSGQERWHMNRMLRCARDRERAATPQ
ncbi:MAG: hypothetical protein KDC48_20615 [Planctomycetes bacterium]|nr:hypothetical protein [Planctomycetota bacterium]